MPKYDLNCLCKYLILQLSTKYYNWKVMVFIPIIWVNLMSRFFQKSKYLPNSKFLLFVDVSGLQ